MTTITDSDVTPYARQILGNADYRTPAWYAARRECVSASEIAIILGLSKPAWGSPFDLWWNKRTGDDSQPESDDMRKGRRFEADVLDDFADAHPEFVVASAGLLGNIERPWQVCTPDGLAYESPASALDCPVAVVEAKTSNERSEWGEPGTDEIPIYYRCQVMWQMDCLGLNVAFVPVWFGLANYAEYVVEYREADALLMREAAEAFLVSVREDRQPEIDAFAATRRRLRYLHPELTDTTAEIPATLVRQYQKAKATRDRAQDRMNLAENRIRALMGSAAKAEFLDGDGKTRSLSHSIYTVAEHVRSETTVDRINFPRKAVS